MQVLLNSGRVLNIMVSTSTWDKTTHMGSYRSPAEEAWLIVVDKAFSTWETFAGGISADPICAAFFSVVNIFIVYKHLCIYNVADPCLNSLVNLGNEVI